jgi:hypothetical protein
MVIIKARTGRRWVHAWDKFFRKGLGLSYKVRFMNGSKISYEICSLGNDKLVPRPLNS